MRLIPILLFLPLLLLTACNTVGYKEIGINNFDEVSPTLYRGAQPTARGVRTLAALDIKTVINLRDDGNSNEAAEVHDAGMTYISLPQDASHSTPADAENFLTALAAAPKPVFVHCHAGRDRTGLAVAAYRIRDEQWSKHAALKDLYAHGQQWLLFPKVAASIKSLAKSAPPIIPQVAQPPSAVIN